MTTVLRCFGLVLVIAALAVTAAAETDKETPAMEETTQQIVTSSNSFAFKLFDKVMSDAGENENIFISPMSVAYALTMTLNGAGGDTRRAMASTLELSDLANEEINAGWKSFTETLLDSEKDVTFTIANSIWYRRGLPVDDGFVDLNKTTFDAQVKALDFADPGAADIINAWVQDQTNDKIKSIVTPPIKPDQIMFLINAIYFKEMWTNQFKKERTDDHPFHAAAGDTTCRMMRIRDHFRYFENDTLQAIYLPYGDGKFGLTVFLPGPSYKVDDIAPSLATQTWSIGHQGFRRAEVNLKLPRFKFEYGLSLNEMLSAMGMEVAFNPTAADFSNMLTQGAVPGQNVFISEVKHKTFLQVDEEGTEAAAVTSVGMALASARPDPVVDMTVDRPFLFAITNDTFSSIIFIGRIAEPVWEE